MQKILRLIDANINRTLEGLRVCEDIARFMLNDKPTTRSFKSIRHRVGSEAKKIYALAKSRNVKKDIGRKTSLNEGKRKNIKDIYAANIARVKESLRALEEISKLYNRNLAEKFKKLRYRVYELDKKSFLGLEALLHNR